MRFACLLIKHLPTRIETLREPTLARHPIVVLRTWDDQVLDVSHSALAARVELGDSRSRVEQLCPQATIISANEPLYQAIHSEAETTLADFAGPVEIRDLGEFLVEISSLLCIFQSEAELAEKLLTNVQSTTRLVPALGIAGNKFAAAQASKQATSETGNILIVPNGNEKRFLDPLPLSTLPDAPIDLLRRLRLLGITTLGDFAKLPYEAVVNQFGKNLAILHDLACGKGTCPLSPKSPPPMVTCKADLPQPQSNHRLQQNILGRLVGELTDTLRKGGFQATALTLAVTDETHQECTIGAAVKPPAANAHKLRRLSELLLKKLRVKPESLEMRLTAYPLRKQHLGARQITLFQSYDRHPVGQLQQVLHSLHQRFGKTVIQLASTIDPPSPIPIQVHCNSEGTPISLREHRGNWSHRVERTYEYWRECWHWWDSKVTREYYQVEVKCGLIFTLFRDMRGNWFLDHRKS